jgi:hypothetical protein
MIATAFHQARVRSSATGSLSVALEGSRAAKLPPSGAPGWAPRRCPRRGAHLLRALNLSERLRREGESRCQS